MNGQQFDNGPAMTKATTAQLGEMWRLAVQALRAGTAVELMSARWIAATCALTIVFASLLFVGILQVANRLHGDIIPTLAPKLGLLSLHPTLIFAGDSRTAQQVDPVVIADLLGKPKGYAVNIAALGVDPAAVLAAARAAPDVFRHADLVINISPYHINDGLKREFLYSTATIARLGLARELWTFLPRHGRVLVWYIQDTLQGAASGTPPAAARETLLAGRLGYDPVAGTVTPFGSGHRYRDFLRSEIGPYEDHLFFRDWQPDGFKLALVRRSLCELRPLVHRLVIVAPPWAPIPEFTGSLAWRDREREFEGVLKALASGCDLEFVTIDTVDGLGIGQFADEVHVNPEGTPIYDAELLRRLGFDPKPLGDKS